MCVSTGLPHLHVHTGALLLEEAVLVAQALGYHGPAWLVPITPVDAGAWWLRWVVTLPTARAAVRSQTFDCKRSSSSLRASLRGQ